jgi:alpha-glucosidase (family GH31 glycosyl hydrolase)
VTCFYQTLIKDPAAFSDQAQSMMRDALNTRYALLPYLYTLFYRSSIYSETVVRPLFFEFVFYKFLLSHRYPRCQLLFTRILKKKRFPIENITHTIDQQFMLGPALLITPVLQPNVRNVSGWFPDDVWYDLFEGDQVIDVMQFVNLDAPLHKINAHIRGGYIVPLQRPAVTTTLR